MARSAGLEKRYTVPCLEAEILQATVDKDMFPTYLLAEAGELNRYLLCCQYHPAHLASCREHPPHAQPFMPIPHLAAHLVP